MDPMSAALLGSTALSVGGSLFGQSQQQGYQRDMLAQAQRNYELQKQAQEFQQRLATGSRTDALGNKVSWNGSGWVTDTTPGTLGVLLASQANERQKQTAGGIRSELGQENNFKNRGEAGVAAGSALRDYVNNAGRPTLEGVRGRDIVAGATEAGNTTSALTDAVARNVLRGGGSPVVAQNALRSVGTQGANNLRIAVANANRDAPGETLNQDQAWTSNMMNKYAPLSSVAGNISDTAVAPTQAAAPIDAMLGQAATYGAATYGRGGATTDSANSGMLGIPNSPINYGGATTALTQSLMQYLKSRGGAGGGVTSNQVGGPDGWGGLNSPF
jgi:hypothetical protein